MKPSKQSAQDVVLCTVGRPLHAWIPLQFVTMETQTFREKLLKRIVVAFYSVLV